MHFQGSIVAPSGLFIPDSFLRTLPLFFQTQHQQDSGTALRSETWSEIVNSSSSWLRAKQGFRSSSDPKIGKYLLWCWYNSSLPSSSRTKCFPSQFHQSLSGSDQSTHPPLSWIFSIPPGPCFGCCWKTHGCARRACTLIYCRTLGVGRSAMQHCCGPCMSLLSLLWLACLRVYCDILNLLTLVIIC